MTPMPRIHTYNPLALKTGDKVWFVVTEENAKKDGSSFSGLFFNPRMASAIVVEKFETLSVISPTLTKRSFKFTLNVSMALSSGAVKIVVDEQSPMFKTPEQLAKYLHSRLDSTLKGVLDHEERQVDYREFKLIDTQVI